MISAVCKTCWKPRLLYSNDSKLRENSDFYSIYSCSYKLVVVSKCGQTFFLRRCQTTMALISVSSSDWWNFSSWIVNAPSTIDKPQVYFRAISSPGRKYHQSMYTKSQLWLTSRMSYCKLDAMVVGVRGSRLNFPIRQGIYPPVIPLLSLNFVINGAVI